MTELQTYQSDPNDALLELGPADDDVMHWNAVMKGVVGTAYEGTPKPFSLSQSRMAVSPYLTPPQAADGSSTSTFPTHIPSRRPPFAS
jgi:hypothetical protein